MNRLITALTIFIFSYTFAQEADITMVRLQKEVELAQTDSIKINALIDLSARQVGGILSKAESTLEEAFKLIHNQQPINQHQLGAAYIQMGVLHRRKGEHTDAADYYLRALEIFKSQKDSLLMSDVYHNLGMLYRHQKENRKAIKHYKMSISIKEKIKDTHGLGAGYNMMGVSYRFLKDLDSAVICYDKAKALFRTIKSPEDVKIVNNNMAVVYSYRKEYDKALELNIENIAYATKLDKKFSLSTTYYNMANIYRKTANYSKALEAVDSCIAIAKEAGFRENIAKGYLRKSFIYNKMGDYKNAYDYYRIFNRHSDSIYNIENVKKIQKLELNHQFRQEKLSDSLVFAQEKKEVALLAESESSKKRLYLVLFVLAIAAAGIIGFLIRREYRSRTQIALERLEKEKAQKDLLDQKIIAKEEEIKRLVADNTMRLNFKEELLNQLKRELTEKKPEELKASLSSLTKELKSQIHTEGKLSTIQSKIEEVNQGFNTKLSALYPELTKTEREVCALLRLNLSIKEIMTIRNASQDAVKSIRYRIRKKMGLTPKEELEQFIQAL